MKKIIYSLALLMGTVTFAACSSDNDNDDDNTGEFKIVTTTPFVDQDNYALNTTAANYSSRTFGQTAIDGCID
jgi:hypothetical protein